MAQPCTAWTGLRCTTVYVTSLSSEQERLERRPELPDHCWQHNTIQWIHHTAFLVIFDVIRQTVVIAEVSVGAV